MSSMQRRRGQIARIYLTEAATDNRGNKVLHPSDTNFVDRRVVLVPQRSARAEVPGQIPINVVRMIVDPKLLPDVDLWSRVEVMGHEWDVVAPPAYRHGTRHTRHLSIDLRERP